MTEIDIKACKCGINMVKSVTGIDDLIEGLVYSKVFENKDKDLSYAYKEQCDLLEDSLKQMEKYCGINTINSVESIKNISKIVEEKQKLESADVDKIKDLIKKIKDELDPQVEKCY